VTIARRTCIDHLRKRRHQPVTTSLVPEEALNPGLATGETVRSSAESREEVERLKGALADVPPNPRRALELVLFTELTQSEIAERLEQPEGTVKSWIRRGLMDLRKALTEGPP
jgi:RNA polymerase sigma-70 factor (ECF subfamily)